MSRWIINSYFKDIDIDCYILCVDVVRLFDRSSIFIMLKGCCRANPGHIGQTTRRKGTASFLSGLTRRG